MGLQNTLEAQQSLNKSQVPTRYLCCSSMLSYKFNSELRCQSSLSSLEFIDTSIIKWQRKIHYHSTAPNRILFMSIFKFQNAPGLLKASLFPSVFLQVSMPHCSSQSSTATPSPHWSSAQSFSSLEYFHFPHKAPPCDQCDV